MLSAQSVLLSAVLGACLLLVVLQNTRDPLLQRFRHNGRSLMDFSTIHNPNREDSLVPVSRPKWNGVLPDNIIDQQLPMVRNPHYGVHIFALGKNGSLFHKYQTGQPNMSDPMAEVPFTKWLSLTPSTYKNTSGVALPLIFANSPAVALNADGRIELFVAFQPGSLDIWQMYQTDATNPLAWSAIRAPYCDPAFADCRKCLAEPDCRKQFWSSGYLWTTSQQSLWLDPRDKKLRLMWRNFDGHMYEMPQNEPSKSDLWDEQSLQYPVCE
mmetsp:Transcript_658/g.1531  ORF Transcript_658/g.1531 Transcript_658/m.1531 type:complete len:269 (-) Transcript_658:89-895(-)|eukprot:CAMPEP_0180442900 /NCGR_PEP_ID=MMETSP1036_2-20121128/14383_1 /TAXON_ID=632150 /ORGANISM="Azadinium spinosum, Strain 3D9" /LENGTH=268 /DNA_ID=CAMNT_0022449167 /DNA_START=68 /DNA_END=874 /DNA_ORIENTATION=+